MQFGSTGNMVLFGAVPVIMAKTTELVGRCGNAVLSDVDIALFFAGPFGWVSAVAIGAVWLAILALEQTSLLATVAARSNGMQLGTLESLRFTARRSLTILRVAGRLIAAS